MALKPLLAILLTLTTLTTAIPMPAPADQSFFTCPPGLPIGSLACVSEISFAICSDWTAGSQVMPVAVGTVCRNNAIVAADNPAPAPAPAAAPEPPAAPTILVQDDPDSIMQKRDVGDEDEDADVDMAAYELERAKWF